MKTARIAQGARGHTQRAFTMIELLTVIAIIAILAAILFPIFGTVREQARQSNTISNLHAVYVATKQYQDDEGRFPPVLFGYAETVVNGSNQFATTNDLGNITPMDGIKLGTLYREHLKDSGSFVNADNSVTNKSEVTQVHYPLNSPYKPGELVVWEKGDSSGSCPISGDPDLPNDSYAGQSKLFYKMDSMDIGPMLDEYGRQAYESDGVTPKYELHYSPDWTRRLGAACDTIDNKPVVTQLKYKNPPADRTVITYITQHAATTGSPNVIVLLLSGTVRKVNYMKANGQAYTLPVFYGQ